MTMGEKAKEAATTATKLIDKLPADKREIAARLAETYAAGLAAAWSWQRRKAAAEVKSERRGECEITRQRIHYWFYTENQRHELKGV